MRAKRKEEARGQEDGEGRKGGTERRKRDGMEGIGK